MPFAMPSLLVLGGVLLAGTPIPKLELAEPVRKLWDQAPHNAFTDLCRHGGQWYCVFREGAGHATGAGKIRVLTSADGRQWQSAALIAQDGVDLRDPHLSVTPGGRLMLIGGAAVPPTRDPVKEHYSFVCLSKDGKKWTAPRRVTDNWHWLWRVTWHGRKAYGVAYEWDPAKKGTYRASLFHGETPLTFARLTRFDITQPTEAAIAFDGERMLCLQRRDGKPNTAMLGMSKAPYRDWKWKDLGMYFGGPNFLRTPDGVWLAAGRIVTAGKAQTAVCRLDVDAGKLEPLVTLPSGGDNSYPGMVWLDGELWLSYYSSHEGKTSIYLARLKPVK